jgi:hypothetical protein
VSDAVSSLRDVGFADIERQGWGDLDVEVRDTVHDGDATASTDIAHTKILLSASAVKKNGYDKGKPLPKHRDIYGPDGKFLQRMPPFTTAHDVASVLRHEYAHMAHSRMSREQESSVFRLMPLKSDNTFDFEQIARDLSMNAGADRHEALAEVFALTTDDQWKPDEWAPWITEAGNQLANILFDERPK